MIALWISSLIALLLAKSLRGWWDKQQPLLYIVDIEPHGAGKCSGF